jgi:hypothetical protein
MLRKLVSVLTVFALATLGFSQVSPASAAECVSTGSGSVGSPYIICNAADFTALKTATSGNYVLGADIDLTGVAWDDNSSFNGTLNGAGHTVNGLTIISNSTTQVNGMFSDLGEDSVIENIKFTNASLSVDNRSYAGILAYRIFGQVSQVEVQGTVTTNSGYTGGLAGQLNGGAIMNTISNVTMTQTSGGYMGGFFGTVSGTPTDSIGTISNSMFIGTMTGGSTQPISLSGMPWWGPEDNNPPMPTCDYATGTFYVSTAATAPEGCGNSITEAQLKGATSASLGFEFWNDGVWSFPGGSSYPLLRQFISTPVEKLFPEAVSKPGSIELRLLPPVGDYVTGYEVQVRTALAGWVDKQTLVVGGPAFSLSSASISGLTNGETYWVRIRSINPSARGDWNYVLNSVTPIGLAASLPVASAKTAKSKITVKWLAPTVTNGSAVTSYNVGVFKTATSATPYKVIRVGNKLLATVSGIKAGTNVWLAIQATNGAGANVYGAKTKIKVKK